MSEWERHTYHIRGRKRLFLERFFGFNNDSFRTYMHMVDTNWFPPQQLLYYSSEMAKKADVHPIIGYASGWASAGAALHRDAPKTWMQHDFPLMERLGALYYARTMWRKTEKEFQRKAATETDPKKAENLESFRWRSAQALANLPMMYVAAHWFSGTELPEEEIKLATQVTKNNLVDLVVRMRRESRGNTLFEKAKGGVCNEIFSELLILDEPDPSQRFIVYPGSLQFDNNPEADLRTDLEAVSTGILHQSAPIQVTSKNDLNEELTDKRVVIRTGKDLVLSSRQGPGVALDAFIAKEQGKLHSPDVRLRLAIRTNTIVNRIHEFINRRKKGKRKITI